MSTTAQSPSPLVPVDESVLDESAPVDALPTPAADREGILERLRGRLEPLLGREVLFGLDVDGTLVDHDGRMTIAMHEALQQAATQQHVVIATGRSLGATLPIVRAAGVEHGFAVCSNGAVTVQLDPAEPEGWRIIDTRTFQPQEALEKLREVAPQAHYAVEVASGEVYATPGFQDASFGVETIATELDELVVMEAVRVVVHVPDLSADEFRELIRDSGVNGVQYAIGWTAWLDIAAPGVSKASALEMVRETLGIAPDATVAVGDGFNDLEMLRWAGVGVAMGQALPGVKEAADLETLDIWSDGTAEVLRVLVG